MKVTIRAHFETADGLHAEEPLLLHVEQLPPVPPRVVYRAVAQRPTEASLSEEVSPIGPTLQRREYELERFGRTYWEAWYREVAR